MMKSLRWYAAAMFLGSIYATSWVACYAAADQDLGEACDLGELCDLEEHYERVGTHLSTGTEGCVEHWRSLASGDDVAIKSRYDGSVDEFVILKKASASPYVLPFIALAHIKTRKRRCVVMPFAPTNLASYLKVTAPSCTDFTVRLFIYDLLESIKGLHRLGIVHLDLFLGNVVIFQGRPRIIDFGKAVLTTLSRKSDRKAALHLVATLLASRPSAAVCEDAKNFAAWLNSNAERLVLQEDWADVLLSQPWMASFKNGEHSSIRHAQAAGR